MKLVASRTTKGFSLTELIVVIAIFVILAALLLAAVQNARESARKVTCVGNLRQIGLAVANYTSTFGRFPPGGMQNEYSAHVRLLPFLELESIHQQINYEGILALEINKYKLDTPTVFRCPSSSNSSRKSGQITQTSYVGIFAGGVDDQENGIFVTVGPSSSSLIGPAQVTDGLSNTLMFAETDGFAHPSAGNFNEIPLRSRSFNMPHGYVLPDQLGEFYSDCLNLEIGQLNGVNLGGRWMFGSTGVTRMSCIFPRLPRNCTNAASTTKALYAPSSVHEGSFTAAMADGSIHRLPESIDLFVWRGIGSRDGNEVVSLP